MTKSYCECGGSINCRNGIDSCRCDYCGKPSLWLIEKWREEDKKREEMAKEEGSYWNP